MNRVLFELDYSVLTVFLHFGDIHVMNILDVSDRDFIAKGLVNILLGRVVEYFGNIVVGLGTDLEVG
jgi:hypothetical protein